MSLPCDLRKAGSVLAKGRHDAAAAVDATVQAVSNAADDTYTDLIRPGWELTVRAAQAEANAVEDAAEYGIHAAGTVVKYAAQAGARIYKAATNAASAVGKAAVNLVKTAYHDAKKAATATVAFVKNHAAAITSIVVRCHGGTSRYPPSPCFAVGEVNPELVGHVAEVRILTLNLTPEIRAGLENQLVVAGRLEDGAQIIDHFPDELFGDIEEFRLMVYES